MKNDAVLTEKKQRIEYIDCAKFIGIFLLLVEHAGNWSDLSGGGDSTLKLWICSFHMPLFFIVYGMVSSYKGLKSWNDWKKYSLHQIKVLVVPYVLWAMIYANGFEAKFFLGVGYGSNPSLSYANTNAVLWFLPAMFMSTLFYQFVLNFLNDKTNRAAYTRLCIWIIALIVLAQLCCKVGGIRFPWGIDIALLGTVFMLVGHYGIRQVLSCSLQDAKRSFLLFLLCSLVGVVLSYVNKPLDGPYPVTVMAIAEYGKNIVVFVLGAVASTTVILLVSSHIKGRWISYLGQHTLVIMAVHYILFPYTLFLAKIVFGGISSILTALLNAVFVTALCVPISMLTDRFCPCLNGK